MTCPEIDATCDALLSCLLAHRGCEIVNFGVGERGVRVVGFDEIVANPSRQTACERPRENCRFFGFDRLPVSRARAGFGGKHERRSDLCGTRTGGQDSGNRTSRGDPAGSDERHGRRGPDKIQQR